MHDTYLKLRGVAHDINGLMARAGLAAEQLREHQDIAVKQRADRIAEAIDQVAEICRDQLTESLITKNGRVHRTPCVERLIRQVTDLVHVEALIGKQVFAFQHSVEKNVRLACNTPSLFRVLFNLTLNAANAIAMHGGSWIEISVTQAYGRVFFDIADDGPGLPEHVLAYLYPRADAQAAQQGPIGSGLITAVSLAREMGGELRLIKSTASGTNFCLSLPQEPVQPLDGRPVNTLRPNLLTTTTNNFIVGGVAD